MHDIDLLLSFPDDDVSDFLGFFQANAVVNGIPENSARPVSVLPPGAFGAVDPAAVVIALAGSAATATVVRGALTLLRDYLNHRMQIKKLQLSRSRISIKCADLELEVDERTPAREWNKIHDTIMLTLNATIDDDSDDPQPDVI